MKGSYILLIELAEEQAIATGGLKVIHFARGNYVYAGSALGGLESRLGRHLRRNKKLHWHIDYLLQKASINSIIICETGDRLECTIARALDRKFDSIPGFGSSDCKCSSHLFFAAGNTEDIEREIMEIIGSLGMKARLMENIGQEPLFMGAWR